MTDYRISRVQLFMQIAEVVSRRSTCFRRNVGAIIVKDNNIVSLGYNGSPSGEPHCTGNGCADPVKGCTRAIHAERNAIDRLPAISGPLTMYVTESPCAHCAEYMVNHMKFEAVYFMHQYRLIEGCELLVKAGINLYRVTPAGHVIYWKTGAFVEAR